MNLEFPIRKKSEQLALMPLVIEKNAHLQMQLNAMLLEEKSNVVLLVILIRL